MLIKVNKSSVIVEEDDDELPFSNVPSVDESNKIEETTKNDNTILLDEIQEKNIFEVFCKGNTFLVNGIYSLTDNSLTVISGSTINQNVDDFANKHFSNKYRDNPLYVDDNFKVLQNIKFNTSGGAGVFVCGKKVMVQ